MASYFMGIDVGTSSTKAILVDETGEVVGSSTPTYNFDIPRPLWAESNPEDWWEAAVEAIRELVGQVGAEQISAIGLTGQMHGLVMLDADGTVVRPCIMWNDQRTGAQCRSLTEKMGADRVLAITGNPILPGFTAPKIAWVQENEPEAFARTAKILLPKDYLRFRLSGEFSTEVSDASGTSLLDVGARRWSPEMLGLVGLREDQLAPVSESVEITAKVSPEVAELTGLLAGTPIAAGGGDQAAGGVGCGVVKPGLVSCTLGTSGVVFAHSETFQPDPQGRLHAFCSAVPGKWHFMGVQLSCAGSYQWLHDKILPDRSFADLDALAAAAPVGSDGLFFLPYLTGERTPHPDPNARGAFVGLTLRHDRSHLARSVLEGVTFGLRDGLEIMRELSIRPSAVIASGGGSKSPLWRQILADCFETEIVTVNASEGAAYGAAILGAVGTGFSGSVEECCDGWIRETGRIAPGPAAADYDRHYPLFAGLYSRLRESYDRIADLYA